MDLAPGWGVRVPSKSIHGIRIMANPGLSWVGSQQNKSMDNHRSIGKDSLLGKQSDGNRKNIGSTSRMENRQKHFG